MEGVYNTNKRRLWVSILLVAAIVFLIVYISYSYFYDPIECYNYECFQQKMSSCSKASYINEENEASWRYIIKGTKGNQCEVEVKLLQPKAGELGIEELRGLEMTCLYDLGFTGYPEDDINSCTGKLKEELQAIVIEKLHTYVLENLGRFDEELNRVGS